MFRSSSQTPFHKYFLPSIFIVAISFSIALRSDTLEMREYVPIVGIWIGIMLIQTPFRLTNVKAGNESLEIKRGKKTEYVNYSNVISISKFNLAGPNYITLKYFDPSSGSDKTICYLPSRKDRRTMNMDAMSSFIRNKAKMNNPNYINVSSLRNFAILVLLSIPFLVIDYIINFYI